MAKDTNKVLLPPGVTPPKDSADVRRRLIKALQLDLVGPRTGDKDDADYQEEVLPSAPSFYYLTGFLVPYEADGQRSINFEVDEELDEGGDESADESEGGDQASKRKVFFPSSMGLSFLLSPETKELDVSVLWGEYAPITVPAESGEGGEGTGRRNARAAWRRTARKADGKIPIAKIPIGKGTKEIDVPDSGGLKLAVVVRKAGEVMFLPKGTLSVSVFLVNKRPVVAEDEVRDTALVFQPELQLTCAEGFIPRPNVQGLNSTEYEDNVADVQYHDVHEFAVGHAVSARCIDAHQGRCTKIATDWTPIAQVEKVLPADCPGVERDMETLAQAKDFAALSGMLEALPAEYAKWITARHVALPDDARRRKVATELLKDADRARKRIEAGIATLADPLVFRAFQVMNRTVARALRQRECHGKADADPAAVKPPRWHPFQLAFILLNLAGVVDSEHPDRDTVDLLFFPTGGGKTEAYLGLAAFTIMLRRLRDPSIQSSGVTVLMRYTLRLLTLDQLGRASTLICALELERQADEAAFGKWPLEIGLWVGKAATPNVMGEVNDKRDDTARIRTNRFQQDDRRHPSPIPLAECAWCGAKFTKDSFHLIGNKEKPTDLRASCTDRRCVFHIRSQKSGLPVVTVDEPIYRRLPAFLIATVDKFASLPWVGQVGALFGKVDRFDDKGFYGPAESTPGQKLTGPLPPPALIIQDELHLISGPLGTIAGLYEAAIDALCHVPVGYEGAGPKIIASTATVRRASKQIRALFGRSTVDVFPPPLPDRSHSFFARTAPYTEANPRQYIGIAAQGRSLKVVLLRSYVALLAAANLQWLAAGGSKPDANPADPYMTLLGYFSSLRELGGSRRIVEDEIRAGLADVAERRQRLNVDQLLLADRPNLREPQELTSRVPTNEVAGTKLGLSRPYSTAKTSEHVDVALATNMISVGLDITRLGLMVVLGQPKTTAEYIQTTSRVGRDDMRPGLVLTLLNIHRPRDRSHYERFASWHDAFYRAVEATSVTPFSARAVDRVLAAVTVGLARQGLAELTAPLKAFDIGKVRSKLGFVSETLSRRAEAHASLNAEEAEALRHRVKSYVEKVLDAWTQVAKPKQAMQYQKYEAATGSPLLFDPLDSDLAKQPNEAQYFRAQRSMRDVEASVNLWPRTPDGRTELES